MDRRNAKRVAGMSPELLFQNGELGAWWDVQDTSTLFSDTAMTTLAVVDGTVAAHADKSGNGNHRIQATVASQPILRQHADGRHYLDYSGSKKLEVPSSTATFKFLHDGTGGSVCAWIEWLQGGTTSLYLGTQPNSSNQIGFHIVKSTTLQNVVVRINNGLDATRPATTSLLQFAVSDAPRMLCFSYKNNGAADDLSLSMDSSRDYRITTTANAPTTAASASDLSNHSSFNSYEYEVIIINRVLTQVERQQLYTYMKARNDYPVPSIDLRVLLGGQSNQQGVGSMTSPSLPETKLAGVYSYTRAEEARIAVEPTHTILNRPVATSPDVPSNPQSHSWALQLGKALKTDAGINTLLIPCAIGSTSIAQWDTPSEIKNRTKLLGAMRYRYERTAKYGGDPVIIWYGHEADAADAVPDYVNGGVGNTYETNLTSLLNNVRSLVVDAPIILIQLASDDTLSIAQNNAAAGEAMRQMELNISNLHLVVAHDVQRNASPDDIHVSREGQAVLAARAALAIREHVLGEAVNGTGPRISYSYWTGSTVTLVLDKAINTTVGNYGDLFRIYDDTVEQTVSSANRATNTSKIDIVCSAPLSDTVALTYGYKAGAASAARTDFVADSDGLPLPLFGPIIVRHRDNLLDWTQEFDTETSGAYWSKTGTTVSGNAIASPDGTTTADSVIESAATANHNINRAGVYTAAGAGETLTLSMYVKSISGDRRLQLVLSGAAYATTKRGCFNLQSLTFTLPTGMTGSYTDEGDGWYRVAVTSNTQAAGSVTIFMAMSELDTTASASYTGDGVSTLVYWGVQLEVGALTDYQYMGAP